MTKQICTSNRQIVKTYLQTIGPMTRSEVVKRSEESTKILNDTYGRLQRELLTPILKHFKIKIGEGKVSIAYNIHEDGHGNLSCKTIDMDKS